MQDETRVHVNQSRKFLSQAFEELDAGDLLQASEKGWGAAAQMVKAVAVERGWEHSRHRQLRLAVTKLTDETDSLEISLGFAVAESLHANFYEGWLDGATLKGYLDRVSALALQLEGVLDGANGR
ncbi:MAG: PaREP1 family protein [Chloroflexota bacterium]|nr:PaREP1 family protein [Chloroflexota bacterium]MDE2942432.1 PaREP1 family protein [Chloroflexota bacterium]MDE3267888.1 PaREP1 family protein [Chloroflexota bacterium]